MSREPVRRARIELAELVRSTGRDVLAGLTRITGDLALAEDAVQDATIRALEVWPRDGVPENPVAWLRLTARRRAIDLIRREAARGAKESQAAERTSPISNDWPDPRFDDEDADPRLGDDLLRLLFTCCHPSLATETQVCLALRTLCGLTTAEVARALLVPE
ncbi:MAG: sigma factor, partial [Nocardioides sp.]